MIKTAILTVSDTRTKENDLSGQTIQKALKKDDFEICAYDIVRDEKEEIKSKLIHYADNLGVDMILTNGGTGLSPSDVTPEATMEIIEKLTWGISEFIRAQGVEKTKKSILSRGISGIRKHTLIINLPGSPKAVEESLAAIYEIIPHAISMLKGEGHG